MNGLVVRFDEELSVAHVIADGALPCPRGVVVTRPHPWTPSLGTEWSVKPCSLTYGHNGDCEAGIRDKVTTVCGLPLSSLPFVPIPDGMPACPDCFDTDEVAFIADAFDFDGPPVATRIVPGRRETTR